MKRIAIDMDEVIADFVPKHLAVFNRDFNETITVEHLMGKKLRDLRPHLNDEIVKCLHDPAFFRDLEVMKDSQDVGTSNGLPAKAYCSRRRITYMNKAM